MALLPSSPDPLRGDTLDAMQAKITSIETFIASIDRTKLAPEELEKVTELDRVTARGRSMFLRIENILKPQASLPEAPEGIRELVEKEYEALRAEYEAMVTLRSAVALMTTRRDLKLDAGAHPVTVLRERVEKAFTGNPLIEAIGRDIAAMIDRADPENMESPYYERNDDGSIKGIVQKPMFADVHTLKEIASRSALTPEQRELATVHVMRLIEAQQQSDPLSYEWARQNPSINKGPKGRRNRIMLAAVALGGTTLAVWGLLVDNKGYALVAGVGTLLYLKPDLLRGEGDRAIAKLKFLDEDVTKQLIGNTMKGKDSIAALRQFFDATNDQSVSQKIASLRRGIGISNAQIADVFDGKEYEGLRTFLMGLSVEQGPGGMSERELWIERFFRLRNQPELQELTTAYIERTHGESIAVKVPSPPKEGSTTA